MKLLTGSFEVEPLLAHWIQVVAPRIANWTQAVAPLLIHCIGAVPYRIPKHKENDRSRKKLLDQVWKQSIKGRNDSDLNRSGSFKPKLTKSKSRYD